MDIISRKEAKQQGLIFYFTGRPCKHGHIAKRYVSGSKCHQCKTNVEQSGRRDGKKLDPSALNSRSIPMPALDDTMLHDLSRVTLDTTGIIMDDREGLSKQEWTSLARVATKIETFKSWLIGDLWNLCRWGDKANMMTSLGINPKTAEVYGFVAKKIPHEMRRAALGFTHHMVIACSEKVTTEVKVIQWLDTAELNKMSVRALKKNLEGQQITHQEDKTTKLLSQFEELANKLISTDGVTIRQQEIISNALHQLEQENKS